MTLIYRNPTPVLDFALRCVIPVVCVTKWEVRAYSRTTQLIRRKDVLFYYEKLHVSAYIGHHQVFYRLRRYNRVLGT